MMIKSNTKQGGFTIIEMVISLVMLGILGVVTTMFLYTDII